MPASNGLTVYSALSGRLSNALALKQAPIAISFVDTLPPGMDEHASTVAAGCRFWQDATTASFATTPEDHSLCAIGLYTHNLGLSPRTQTDLADAMKVFADLGYVRPEDLAAIPVLKSRSRYVVYSPLAACSAAPGVVLLFVSASQTLILSEAVQQVEGHNAPAMGRPACAVIPQVINSGHAALSLGCCGARAYLDILTAGTALFALPSANLEEYVQRIEALANANRLLSHFHAVRRRDVEAGETPTIRESLARIS